MKREWFNWHETMMAVQSAVILAALTGGNPTLVVSESEIVLGITHERP